MSPAIIESSSTAPPALWDPRDNVPESVHGFLSQKKPNNLLAFLNVVQQLKVQKRTGWLDYSMTECESIADHMYRMSIISMLISNPKVNRDRCVRIALVHDMAEALVGDITPVNPIGKDEKHRREEATMRYICDEIVRPISASGAAEMLADFLEYESIGSLEARYVKDIDKYELLVQCFEYEKAHEGKLNFQEFFIAREWIETEEVSQWADDLIALRKEYFDSIQG